MLVKLESAALCGLDGIKVIVEIDAGSGLPGQSIVGLPDAAVRESRDRVKCAIVNSGFEYPASYFTINLAPGDIRKEGPMYDLPIAIGLLCASSQVSAENLNGIFLLGELSLNGDVRPVSGILPMCFSLYKKGIKKVIVSQENADEAALIENLAVIPVSTLTETTKYLNNEKNIRPHKINIEALFSENQEFDLDFKEVKGQMHAKRALEIASAGGHNILMVGPPGSGKTMLAKRLPSILPPLSLDEALEITKLYSVTGLLAQKNILITKRPFRTPHHTTSNIGIIGGGRMPKPGEVSLAHLGVLFFDELPEFSREVLEVLREPLEDGKVTVSRAAGSITYPANFMFVAAMNPCPCGNYMDPLKSCTCASSQIHRYISKLSGPLLDRIDLHIEVPRLNKDELSSKPDGEESKLIRKRVMRAREIQNTRSKKINAHLTPRLMHSFCSLEKSAENLLKSAITHFNLSGRAYDKTIKIARTIADLESSEKIKDDHIAEALQYRTLDKKK